MRVRVVLASVYREAARVKELDLDLPNGSTIRDLALMLSELYGGPFTRLIDEDGSIDKEALLLVNGMSLKEARVELKDGDFVFISSEIVGGGLLIGRPSL
ncbi:MAG: MoaD/ThiS family protein [Candidatus Nezhaarchaeota archaeon]|nr:MoaD/ThiS family protein [Candidatus Nezhaarchaeota archaeon]